MASESQENVKASKICGKASLVTEIARKTTLSKGDIEKMFDAMLESVTEALLAHAAVRLPGIGGFSVVYRQASVRRNLQTGEPVEIPASYVVRFSVGKSLKESVRQAPVQEQAA